MQKTSKLLTWLALKLFDPRKWVLCYYLSGNADKIVTWRVLLVLKHCCCYCCIEDSPGSFCHFLFGQTQMHTRTEVSWKCNGSGKGVDSSFVFLIDFGTQLEYILLILLIQCLLDTQSYKLMQLCMLMCLSRLRSTLAKSSSNTLRCFLLCGCKVSSSESMSPLLGRPVWNNRVGCECSSVCWSTAQALLHECGQVTRYITLTRIYYLSGWKGLRGKAFLKAYNSHENIVGQQLYQW